MAGYEKQLDFARMKSGYDDACRRAGALDQQANLHADPGRNPTTGVRGLTELIRRG